MYIGNRRFSPGVWPTAITLILLPLLLYLGFWQLDRAEQKSALLVQNLQRAKQDPIYDLRPPADVDFLLWRRAILSGKFRGVPTFLLDNQVIKSEVGYFVYSLFELDNKSTVLVNRGWVKAGTTREDIPELKTPESRLKISGMIKSFPVTGMLLAENTDEDLGNGLFRLQHISPAQLAENYELTLLPYVIRLDGDSAAGYLREWPQVGSGSEKHLGYAFQWFAMASALLVIFLLVNLKKVTENNSET